MHKTLTQFIMYDGREYDRPSSLLGCYCIDLPYGCLSLVNSINKWQSNLIELMFVELGQQAVTKGFRCHACLV